MRDSADLILIKAAMDGDRPAFAELVGKYRGAVLGTVRRTLGNTMESEDAVQEIFMRAMVSLPRYDLRYPFAPWILKIASNYCVDQLRRKKARKYRLWSDLSEADEGKILRRMSTQPNKEELAQEDRRKYLEVAQSLLDRLKPKRRIAFVLKEIEGRSYEEVSSILGAPEVTVRVRVWRARADLHQGFREYMSALRRGVHHEKPL
jgi:RNA polymerase sigma-70 factor, ECF subfamily